MTGKNQPIAIAVAADRSYAMPLAVTLCSVLGNSSRDRPINFYILDGGIEPFQKRRIERLATDQNVAIEWIKPSADLFLQLPCSEKYPASIYYRLLLPQILPPQFRRVIYLDTDIVVLGDVAQLWTAEMGDRHLLAVQDVCCPYVSMAGGLKNQPELRNSKDLKYFNTGVLVLDLEKWRRDRVGERTIEYLRQNASIVRFPDQDALNAVLAGQWGELEPQWNQMHAIHAFSSWQDSPYSQAAFDRAIHQPCIVHYTTRPKPWMTGCDHPERQRFFEYLDKTAWSGWRNTVWRRLARRVMKEIRPVHRRSLPQQHTLSKSPI